MSELISLFVAFAGGIFGASLGAQPAFIFVGVLVLAGAVIQALGGDANLLGGVAFGAFGPHVGGFAAGVAAAAYAAKKGKLATGRDVGTSLMGVNSPDTLLVGGLFGLVGYGLNWVFSLIKIPWTDTVALSVVVSAIIARVLFGKSGVFGKVTGAQTRYAPNEATQWLPWMSRPLQLLAIGLGAGTFSAFVALFLGAERGGGVFCFGFSAASLILLQFGNKIPVTHHITLVAAVAALASGSIVWGGLFGILAAFTGEFMANTFNVHGDTHIDPPAAAIATLTSLSLVLSALGVYNLF